MPDINKSSMKILVAGCAGFIGSHLSEELLKNKNYQIIGLDIFDTSHNICQKMCNLEILRHHRNFLFFEEDVCTTQIVSLHKPDIVVNLVNSSCDVDESKKCIKATIEGQTNLLKESAENNVKLFVYAFSTSRFAINIDSFDEHDKKKSFSELSKTCSEKLAQLYNKIYDLNVIGLRMPTVYGPRSNCRSQPYRIINNILNGELISNSNDKLICFDYIYVDDIVEGIIGAIKNKNHRKCEIYNLNNPKSTDYYNFIKVCEKVLKKNARLDKIRDDLFFVNETNITRETFDLDYNPSTSLENGVQKIYDWLCFRRLYNEEQNRYLEDNILTIGMT